MAPSDNLLNDLDFFGELGRTPDLLRPTLRKKAKNLHLLLNLHYSDLALLDDLDFLKNYDEDVL